MIDDSIGKANGTVNPKILDVAASGQGRIKLTGSKATIPELYLDILQCQPLGLMDRDRIRELEGDLNERPDFPLPDNRFASVCVKLRFILVFTPLCALDRHGRPPVKANVHHGVFAVIHGVDNTNLAVYGFYLAIS